MRANDPERPEQTDNRVRPEDGPQNVSQYRAAIGDCDDDYDPDRDGVQ